MSYVMHPEKSRPVGRSLVRVGIHDESASEAERFDMNNRIRTVKQEPICAIWLLVDGGVASVYDISNNPKLYQRLKTITNAHGLPNCWDSEKME